MSVLRGIFVAGIMVAAIVFLVPLFAMIALAAMGFTIVAGLLGSLMIRHTQKRQYASKYARDYYEAESRFS